MDETHLRLALLALADAAKASLAAAEQLRRRHAALEAKYQSLVARYEANRWLLRELLAEGSDPE